MVLPLCRSGIYLTDQIRCKNRAEDRPLASSTSAAFISTTVFIYPRLPIEIMRLLPQYLPLGLVLGAMASPANVQDESKDLRGRDDTFNLSGFTFTDSNGTKSNGTNSGAAPKLNATGVSGSPNGTGTSSNTTANATQSAQPAPSNIVQPALLQKAIAAVGGQDALVALKGVQWDA